MLNFTTKHTDCFFRCLKFFIYFTRFICNKISTRLNKRKYILA